RNLKIIETLGMGDKRSISILEVGNKRFMVGNTPHQINLLATLSETMSLASEGETVPDDVNTNTRGESKMPFRNLFEVEKKRPLNQAGNALPEDLRLKMRQLREALER
ncbi:MAG TPA: flagellar biosynthetic protein FliO, partial [Acidobacteriota bacterium]|nr:flagellar biosynthetic protein FliO [Acidobacteriota bacterium]